MIYNVCLVDGKTPSLACGTTGGKIVIHSPHEGSVVTEGALPPVRLLNFNKKITALSKGKLYDLRVVIFQSVNPYFYRL